MRILRTIMTVYVVGVLGFFTWQTFTPVLADAPVGYRVLFSFAWPFAVIEAAKMVASRRA